MLHGAAQDRRSGFVVNGPDAHPLPIRICDLRCSPESPFLQAEANARLIAAAPELLAALNEARGIIWSARYPAGTIGDKCLKNVDAAIAKATA